MRVRFHVENAEDAAALIGRIRLIEAAETHPAWHALVKLRDGRILFGPYGAHAGTIVVENDWNLDDQADLAHVARRHGWLPGESRIQVHPTEILWLEFVPEGSPFFLSGARHE